MGDRRIKSSESSDRILPCFPGGMADTAALRATVYKGHLGSSPRESTYAFVLELAYRLVLETNARKRLGVQFSPKVHILL